MGNPEPVRKVRQYDASELLSTFGEQLTELRKKKAPIGSAQTSMQNSLSNVQLGILPVFDNCHSAIKEQRGRCTKEVAV